VCGRVGGVLEAEDLVEALAELRDGVLLLGYEEYFFLLAIPFIYSLTPQLAQVGPSQAHVLLALKLTHQALYLGRALLAQLPLV